MRLVRDRLQFDSRPGALSAGSGREQSLVRPALRTGVPDRTKLRQRPSDQPAWALPGVYWVAYSGSPVVFHEDATSNASLAAKLPRYRLPAYVLAPAALVPDAALENGSRDLAATRVAGGNLAEHAVRIAEYRYQATGFGWGRTNVRLETWFHYVVAAPSEADVAYAALPLAATVAAPILFADDEGGLPGATDRYVWSQRADWFRTPARR